MVRFFSRKSTHSDSAGASSANGRKLAIEPLESRQMLAADMAEITGVVRTDLQGDGNASNDVVVANATATLYRDNGNGQFDSGDSVVGSSVRTNSAGEYTFANVAAGNYFVRITLPSTLQFRDGEEVKAVRVTSDEADGVVGPTIDGFTTFQTVEASPPPVSTDASSLLDPSVEGGERDVWVELTESTNQISSISLATSDGNLYVASGPGATGNVKIVWDGADGDARDVNATGLGGIDLTESGGNTMTGIALTSGADHPNARIKLRIYTDANNWTEFSTLVPESPGGAAAGQAIFNFDDVPTGQSGQGANFANVGALELTFEGVTAVDAQVSLVGLVGRATKRLDFTASPRLGLGDKVWADIDDDGILDAGEQTIPGVKLNLYEDTNLDNRFTSGVDQFVAMQTTGSNGMYKFTDLLPGKYIVQVDSSNFQTGGPLDGLRSSLGNAAAPDPDNDIDNDDNGTPLAGAGVVSQAIMLSAGDEPVNDNDADAPVDSNSNRTVDFGFFGFDLVLDKSVTQTTVAPNDTLNYTITVTNDGPSAAENTTFEDTLPNFVTFVSGTTSLPGVNLQHSNGVVTANFGTMQPGDTVVVTINATVAASATGTLVNTATVRSPKELNVSNNTDSVSNTLSPRIDLQIDKTDSRDPVEAGSTFSYTLDVRNNGPSNATGVVITDVLPATGVTYVGASRQPTTNDGRTLTFNIGNLARGASTSVTIDVLVDDDFTGTLENEARVRGNETETTLNNNQDIEPTLVIPPPPIDLEIDKFDSDDPVEPGSTFSYTLNIRNNGPADATGVVITDTLPATGVTYVGASQTPTTNNGRVLTFAIGDLPVNGTTGVTIEVQVDDDFTGTLVNEARVAGNETEVTLANNVDFENTVVEALPASLGGSVFVDRNDNGVFDPGETPLADVTVRLEGTDEDNNFVSLTTMTGIDGSYLFEDLSPGRYRVIETQPTRYRDGQDHIGTNGGNRGSDPGPFLIPNNLTTQEIDDLFLGIELSSGDNADDYDFGELAVDVTKINFVGAAAWW
ncbi:MAG: SdrD B-like domain-containing protein [Planctomycetota bacterium]